VTRDDAQALLIELRPSASRGDNSRIALVVTVGVTALEIGVFTMLAVFLPPLRVFVVAWALLITGFLVYGLPRFRRRTVIVHTYPSRPPTAKAGA